LDTLRPERKTLRIGEVIEWVLEQLKAPYGIPNMIRLSKETEKPPVSTTSAPNLPNTTRTTVAEFRDEE
jgi:hypothetical protein